MSSHRSKQVIPEDLGFHETPNIAAGIPILELVRKLEEENMLTRHDRAVFFESLKDDNRRDKLVKALIDVELGSNQRFALQRLKAYIHQNAGGLPNGKQRLLPVDNGKAQIAEITENHKLPQVVGAMRPVVQPTNVSSSAPAGFTFVDEGNNRSPSKRSGGPLRRSLNSVIAPTQQASISPRSDENTVGSIVKTDIKQAIQDIVGPEPVYKHNFNICSKLEQRLLEYLQRYGNTRSRSNRRRLGVIVGSGSCNPLTRMHMRRFYLAKQYLESRSDMFVLGSLISPSHGSVVRERYRTNPSEIIPSPHRLALSQLLVSDSKWLAIDPWEITRRRSMDYLSLLEHCSLTIRSHVAEILARYGKTLAAAPGSVVGSTARTKEERAQEYELRIFYLCKSSFVPMVSLASMKAYGYGCVAVCRAPESDYLRSNLGSKWNGILHVVEDEAILDASMDTVSSRKVRDRIRNYESVGALMGELAQEYIDSHKIGEKMNRALPWTDEEKRLPKLSNSPEKRGRKQKEEDQAEDNLSPRPIRDEDTDSQRKMVQRGKGPGEPSSLPKPSFLPPIGRQVHRL